MRRKLSKSRNMSLRRLSGRRDFNEEEVGKEEIT